MITNQTAAKNQSPKTNKFWNFLDKGDEAELQLFGTIQSEDSWWDDDCVTYRNFIDELNALGDKKTINVVIQSSGGDVFAANAIYSALVMNKAAITGTVLGICASAATIVLMACEKRQIAKNAILMAHNPSVTLWGSYQADDLIKLADVTNQVKKSIVTAYMERLDKTEEEINQLMDEESWYVGQEAVDAGFCDSIIEADCQNSMVSNQFIVDGTSYSFQNYMKKFVPEDVVRKVQNLSQTPKKGSRAFFHAANIPQKGNKKMDEPMVEITDAEGLKAAYPQLCTQIAEAAVLAERARLKEIDAIAKGIPDDILAKARYDEPVTAADLALAQMKANQAAGQQFLAGLKDDAQSSGTAAVVTEPNAGYDPQGQAQAESAQKINGLTAKLKRDKRRESKA